MFLCALKYISKLVEFVHVTFKIELNILNF